MLKNKMLILQMLGVILGGSARYRGGDMGREGVLVFISR